MNMKKALSSVALGTLVALGSFGANAAIEEGQLTVWIFPDKGYNGLAEVGKQFEEDTGIKVSVQYPDDIQNKFAQVAATGDGPDIFIGPHDRIGAYVQSGLLAEVNPSSDVKAAMFDFTWDAVDVKGKYYGYPISVEAISLIYNKALVPNPPKTWEEIEALDKKLSAEGKKAIMWDFKNAYFTWPMMAADGGYIYKRGAAGYDLKDAGIDEKGVNSTLTFMRDLMDKGVISPDMNYGVMDATFAKGETAMIINGPWGWGNADKAGIDYGVTYIPKINGQDAKPMVGVLAAQISTASPNKDLAVEFLESYLLTTEGLGKVNADVPLGAVAHKAFQAELEGDARIAATMNSALNGEAMPNIPEMPKFWDAATKALENIASGRQTVDAALADADKAMIR
jgi:maltose/maltodextrin transport system substrate-binding protein